MPAPEAGNVKKDNKDDLNDPAVLSPGEPFPRNRRLQLLYHHGIEEEGKHCKNPTLKTVVKKRPVQR